MCWFHGEKGIGDRYRHSEMKTSEIKELIDQLAAYRPYVYFGGAEPFIREDFLEILTHAKRLSLPVSFTTNGTLLSKEQIEVIVELGIDSINLSIDGPETIHDTLRGAGCFKKVLSAIDYLVQCKKLKRTEKPILTANLTLSPLIAGRLKETVDTLEAATDGAFDFFRIHHLWFVTPAELHAHQKDVFKTLGCSAPGAEAHCISVSRHPRPGALSDDISQLELMSKVKFFPNLKGDEINAFYSDGYRLRKRCLAPFQAGVVKPNGDFKFCPDEWIDDYVLGNVRNSRLETLWRNKKAKYFRSAIFRKKSFPACKRCSWMHCY
jgi:radical SAM protein with 4Fe4S-binding SPASM domain